MTGVLMRGVIDNSSNELHECNNPDASRAGNSNLMDSVSL